MSGSSTSESRHKGGGSRTERDDRSELTGGGLPTTPYFLWMSKNKKRIRKENPKMTVTEVAKECSRQWRALADKKKWEKRLHMLKKKWQDAVDEVRIGVRHAALPLSP